MAKIQPVQSTRPWATIDQPGATDAPFELWYEVRGAALSFDFAENVADGYPSAFTGRHRYEPLVLTANGLPPRARQWLADLAAGTPARRDVLVEERESDGTVVRSVRYRGAVVVAYAGPLFDGASKDIVRETIEVLFSSAEKVVG